MEKRKYLSVEPSYTHINKQGRINGSFIYGENTMVFCKDTSQRRATDNGKSWNQLVFVIEMENVPNYKGSFSMGVKAKDTRADEQIYVQYGHYLYEQESKEEFYKIALLITKQHLKSSIKSTREQLQLFYDGKYAWPITTNNYKTYEEGLANDIKAMSTIDISDADLLYPQYLVYDPNFAVE
jgi:hypothetical protein